jgi:hypothetical protein
MTPETEPVFPMKRDSPFCPAPMLRGLLVGNPVSRVTLVNGQKSWLTSTLMSGLVRRERASA